MVSDSSFLTVISPYNSKDLSAQYDAYSPVYVPDSDIDIPLTPNSDAPYVENNKTTSSNPCSVISTSVIGDLDDFDFSETLEEIMSLDLMQFGDFDIDETLLETQIIFNEMAELSPSTNIDNQKPMVCSSFDDFAENYDLFPELN